jgi:hypothetical protein
MNAICPPALDLDYPLPPPAPIAEPYYLYLDARHYERVMRKALHRVLAHESNSLSISLRSVIMILVVLGLAGIWIFGPIFTFTIPVMGLVAIGAGVYEMARVSTFRTRLIGARLCLRCGYPLEHLPLNALGGGVCPECGRPFHEREYVCPPDDWYDERWKVRRAAVMPIANSIGSDRTGIPAN